jgi:hypothetical protein
MQKSLRRSRGLDGREPPMKLLGASYVNGELYALTRDEATLQFYIVSGITE